jgi:hypothetical protein
VAGEDPDYTAWLRKQLCCKCAAPAREAHHKTGAGKGLKSHDHTAIPMCLHCHREFHGLSGGFKGWTKSQLREWTDEKIGYYRRIYAGDMPF